MATQVETGPRLTERLVTLETPSVAAQLRRSARDRWTKKGREREMEAPSAAMSLNAQEGWRLHSLQPVPVCGGISQKQTGVILLAVYEHE